MSTQSLFQTALILAALLCSLVAGFLFAFAAVVMPGIAKLNDRRFIRAFQAVDGVIQNKQPLFMLVWVGSVVALLASAALGFALLDPVGRLLLAAATLAYLLGVQLPTAAVNIPLNNQLQAIDLDTTDAPTHHTARHAFEPRWNRSNNLRTAAACLTSALLMILLLRL